MKHKTFLAAALVAAAAALGIPHADGLGDKDASQAVRMDAGSIAHYAIQSSAPNDRQVFGACHDAHYDPGTGQTTHVEHCYRWYDTPDGYSNGLRADYVFHDMGELMYMRAQQDRADPMEAAMATFTIWDKSQTVLAAYELEGDDVALMIRLTDETFDPGCYDISVWFDTPRQFEDEAWDTMNFCVLSGEQSEPLPELTGVRGTVYGDADGNGVQDHGESGIIGVTVLAVNMADFSDIKRTPTNANGTYLLGLEPGDYLVQVEGTPSHAYITVADGSTTVQHLGV